MKHTEYNTKKKLLVKIKEKRELAGIADRIVEEAVDNCLQRYHTDLKKIKQNQTKIIIKEVRAKLRTIVGQFQTKIKKRKRITKQLSRESLLKIHISTAERLSFYPELKKLIRRIKPESILDLGCGLNPIAFAHSGVQYYAADINENDLHLVREFFKKKKIEGRAFFYDIRKIKDDLPKADLCLIFKVFDILKDKNHTLVQRILKRVPSKRVLISFSTKKLSGKPMNSPARLWFEDMLKKLRYNFKKFESQNEIFYLINRAKQLHSRLRETNERRSRSKML